MDWKAKSKNPGRTTEPCWHERSRSLLSNASSELTYLKRMQCSVSIVFTSVVFAWPVATKIIRRGKSPGIMVFGVDIRLTCFVQDDQRTGEVSAERFRLEGYITLILYDWHRQSLMPNFGRWPDHDTSICLHPSEFQCVCRGWYDPSWKSKSQCLIAPRPIWQYHGAYQIGCSR